MKVVIFSNKRINGLMGSYLNPKYFEGNFEGAEIVMTDDAEIAKEAKKQGLEVHPIKGAKQSPLAITVEKEEPKDNGDTATSGKIVQDDSILKPIETPKPRGRKKA